mmetsp:Transcript_83006/g.232639  ORF Transcript_83006/g.232639 Transcript_83006/m.232639 type:complete len:284 (-) Transcript_83006:101-952(-)
MFWSRLLVAALWLAPVECNLGVETAAADDECGSVPGSDGDCALHALQRRARSIARGGSARVARVSEHEGLELKSAFFVGSGVSPAVDCKATAVSGVANSDGPRAALYSSFGAGGGGAVWSYTALVVEDGPARAQVDLRQRVVLAVTVTAQFASWQLTPYLMNVEGMRDTIAMPFSFEARGTPDCPPSYCLLPKPTGEGLPDRVATPDCGFTETSALMISVDGPAEGQAKEVLFDITDLVAEDYTHFKVWASPSSLERRGFWQIPGLTVTSWGFHYATTAKIAE